MRAIGAIIHDSFIFIFYGVPCRRNYFIYDVSWEALKMDSVMKEKLVEEIRKFTAEYQRQGNYSTAWGEPLVGFADGT